ncbi:hypothetical protein OG21DRAFT_1516566 [Imleria badia]|nr:hypothetical protein OG21DRAFT_1516566 [Imleria badia]
MAKVNEQTVALHRIAYTCRFLCFPVLSALQVVHARLCQCGLPVTIANKVIPRNRVSLQNMHTSNLTTRHLPLHSTAQSIVTFLVHGRGSSVEEVVPSHIPQSSRLRSTKPP